MGPEQEDRSVSNDLGGRTQAHNEQFSTNPADEAAVRSLYGQLMEGWNRGSGAAFAAAFAEDGDLVAFDGTHFRGRKEIAIFHQELFDKWMKGTRLLGRVERLRFPNPDVAVIHAVGGTVTRGRSAPSPERNSIQTLVATKRQGEWSLVAFQNTRIRPISRNAAAFLAWTLSDLLWKMFRLNRKTTY